MIARLCLLVLVGLCGACSRSATPPIAEPGPPLTAQPTEPPKPPPVQLGEAPRLKEEPR